jgi:hypothetical protein
MESWRKTARSVWIQPCFSSHNTAHVERESMTVIPEDHAKAPELGYDMRPFVTV